MTTAIARSHRPEILPPGDGEVRVVARPHPFRDERIDIRVPAGLSLQDILDRIQPREALRRHANIALEHAGEVWIVEPQYWRGLRPKPGCTVVIRTVAAGPAIGALIVQAIIATVVSTALSFVVSLLFSPNQPKLGDLADQGERSPTLSGARNQARPYRPVPVVLGKHRAAPAYGAEPYTEVAGSNQYLRLLVVWGIGQYAISDVRIGDTPIRSFQEVETETKSGGAGEPDFTLFPRTVVEESLQITLARGVWHYRTGAPGSTEVSVDFTLPNGLRTFENDGGTRAARIRALAQYRLASGGPWRDMGSQLNLLVDSGDTLRFTRRASGLAPDQYEVGVILIEGATAATNTVDDVLWTAFRSFQNEDPIDASGVAASAIRIRASDQLNGVVDTVNGVVSSILPDWDGAAWVARETSNPASLFRAVLQGAGNPDPVPDSRIDLPSLQDWHGFCAGHGLTFNAVVDFETSVEELLNDIAAAGRAVKVAPDGRYGVVIDRPQSAPIQHLTPRNSFGFRGERMFADKVHGFRVQFVNQAADWQRDERTVFNDGYSDANATKFEDLELFGVTDPDQVHKLGRYHLAVTELRREVYTLETTARHLVCTKGDLVRVTHDVPLWGLGWGRVKALATAGGDTTGVTLDERLEMTAGTTYALRFQLADGASVVRALVTQPGEGADVVFADPIPTGSGPQIGDLAMFGEHGSESVELIVRGIEPGRDLTARLTLVDYAPAVFNADSEAIPPFDSQITAPAAAGTPPVPRIIAVSSDESALEIGDNGALRPTIRIAFDIPGRFRTIVTNVAAEVRETGEADWTNAGSVSDSVASLVIRSVVQGASYDLRLRSLSRDGVWSAWTEARTEYVLGAAANPPDDVPALDADVIGGTIHLSWTPVGNIDLVGYELRYSPSSSNATWLGSQFLARADKRQNTLSAPARNGTYLIRAIDSAGRRSPNAISTATDAAAIADLNVVLGLAADPGFPGTKTNLIVDGGTLKIADRTLRQGFYCFGDGTASDVDLGEIYDAVITPDAEWTAEDSADPTFDDHGGLFDAVPGLFDGEAINQSNVRLQINRSEGSTELFDGATGLFDDRAGLFDGPFAGWQDIRVGTHRFRFASFRLVFESDSDTVTPIVSRLRLTVDMPDRTVGDRDIASGAGVKSIAFAPPFKETPALAITESDMQPGDYREVVAKSRTGFSIVFRNSGGAAVDRRFDWIAKGFGRDLT